MKSNLVKWGVAISMALGPVAAFAQVIPGGAGAGAGAQGLGANVTPVIQDIVDIVTALVPFMLTLAVLFFLWGLAKFVLASGDEEAKETGKRIMIWGVIAIAVMESLWGLVALLQSVFGINDATIYTAPPVQSIVI